MYGVQISNRMCSIYIMSHQFAEFSELVKWDRNTLENFLTPVYTEDFNDSELGKQLIHLSKQSIPENLEYLKIFRQIFPDIMRFIDSGYSLQQICHFIKAKWPMNNHYELIDHIEEHYLILIENSSQWLANFLQNYKSEYPLNRK